MRLLAFLGFELLVFVASGCVSGTPNDSNGEDGGSSGAAGSSAGRGGSAGAGAPGGGASLGGSPHGPGGSAGSTAASGGGGASGAAGTGGSSGIGTAGLGGSSSAGSGGGNNAGNGGTGGKGGATSAAGNNGMAGRPSQPPPIQGGQNAWASRYWDCCKPACGWKGNVRSGNPMQSCDQQNQTLGGNYDARNACESGGSAYMCWNGAPWAVSDTLAFGFAAASQGNYVCGRCFQLQFTGSGHNGNNPGAQSLNGKTMIVQIINNGGVASDQFDILIPGGGVGLLNACDTQWGTSDLGAQYGGFLQACGQGNKDCVRQKCQQVFNGKPDLMAGCDWFLTWYDAADNPNLVYKQIACPEEIKQRSGLGDPG